MSNVVLHLRFDDITSREFWPRVAHVLQLNFPGIAWASDSGRESVPALEDRPRAAKTLFVVSNDSPKWSGDESGRFHLSYSTSYIQDTMLHGWGDIPKPVNGEQWVFDHDVDYDTTNKLFDSLNESIIRKIIKEEINKYRIGDMLYAPESLYFDGRAGVSNRFITQGQLYEIVDIEEGHDWKEYGYRGNRYVILCDGDKREDANHGFSDVYIDKKFIRVPKDITNSSLEIDFDSFS